MARKTKISVLMLDDSEHLVEIYRSDLGSYASIEVSTATDGLRALKLAKSQLFDVLVIDAKLDYRGVEFGGLRLADDLRPRYGANSILVVSQFITRDLLNNHGLDFEFLDKHRRGGRREFVRLLFDTVHTLRKKQFVFVAMPFDEQLNDLYERRIVPAVQASGYRCIRVDQISHNRSIHEVIFDLVDRSKLVIFVADLSSPNAYYEAGFADALGKEVIIVAKALDDLRFDVSNRHTITYGSRPSTLTSQLRKKIDAIRIDTPAGV